MDDERIKSLSEVYQKELIVISAEIMLLKNRIQMMKEFLNSIPSSDPDYTMIVQAIEMDQIELSELNIKMSTLKNQISE